MADTAGPALLAPERFLLGSGASTWLPESLQMVAEPLAKTRGLARLGLAGKDDVAFCDRLPVPSAVNQMGHTTILCSPDLVDGLSAMFPDASLLAVPDPRAGFIDWSRALLAKEQVAVSSRVPQPGRIAGNVRMGDGAWVHPQAQIDEEVVVGARCVIHRGVWLQRGVTVGDGAVLGCSGLNAYRASDGRRLGFPHLASVIVGAGSVIGANAVLVRGILTSTVLGTCCHVGNLCNIGHGVEMGDHVWMSVGCLVGGHTRLAVGATLGLGVQLRDNLSIGAGAQLAMGSVVMRSVADGLSVMGNPARLCPPLSAGPDRGLGETA
jgi:UDP-3-O-[3-hydroxymyristoyl] glucosamine N-acyltransferase